MSIYNSSVRIKRKQKYLKQNRSIALLLPKVTWLSCNLTSKAPRLMLKGIHNLKKAK